MVRQIKSRLKLFFTDKLSVNRRIKVLNEDKSTSFLLPDEPLYENQPCYVSYKKVDNPADNNVDKNPLISVLEIFTDNTLEIKNGDTIRVDKIDVINKTVLQTYTGICNEPILYSTHQQIQVVLKGNA